MIDTVPGAGCHGAAGRCDHEHRVSATGAGAASVTIAPVMAPILALYPVPNLANNQYTFPYTSPSRVDWGQIRVDQNISASDTLFGRYTTDKSYLLQRLRPANGLRRRIPAIWCYLCELRSVRDDLRESHFLSDGAEPVSIFLQPDQLVGG